MHVTLDGADSQLATVAFVLATIGMLKTFCPAHTSSEDPPLLNMTAAMSPERMSYENAVVKFSSGTSVDNKLDTGNPITPEPHMMTTKAAVTTGGTIAPLKGSPARCNTPLVTLNTEK